MNKTVANILKIIILITILLYFISPIDFFPGPIDDAIIGVLGLAAEYGLGKVKYTKID